MDYYKDKCKFQKECTKYWCKFKSDIETKKSKYEVKYWEEKYDIINKNFLI